MPLVEIKNTNQGTIRVEHKDLINTLNTTNEGIAIGNTNSTLKPITAGVIPNVNIGSGISKRENLMMGFDNLSNPQNVNYSVIDSDGSLHTKIIGNINTTNSNITVGQDVKGVGEGLQQVLMYGRKPDGTLQPCETNGDRLLVDVLELAASGKITSSTALSSVQVCGYDTGDNRFRTLNTDTVGRLKTFGEIIQNQVVTNHSLTGSASHSSSSVEIKNGNNNISVEVLTTGSIIGNDINLTLQGSIDNVSFYQIPHSMYEMNHTSNFGRFVKMEYKPKYLRLHINNSGSNTDTINAYIRN